MIINPGKNPKKPIYLIISGPTAAGKTQFSIELAKRYHTEIISFDSRQFFKELEIGTAKPSREELSQVNHHFIGNKSILEDYNAETYSSEARRVLENLGKKFPILVLVGGSGLYLNALLYSFDRIPPVDPSFRILLNEIRIQEGLESLQKLLKEKDPDYFKKVDIQNPQRLIRALEVCLSSQKPYSSFLTEKKEELPGKSIKICLSPSITELYSRINARVDTMILAGLEEEARTFYSEKDRNPLKTVGYTEFFDHFDNKYSRETAIEKIKQHTRNFAKRQLTWFRKDPAYIWMDQPDFSRIEESILI